MTRTEKTNRILAPAAATLSYPTFLLVAWLVALGGALLLERNAPEVDLWLNAEAMRPEIGKAWTVKPDFGNRIRGLFFKIPADDDASGVALSLYEDAKRLGPAQALHDQIRTKGGGAYSYWRGVLYFSTSDGSNPKEGRHRYRIHAETKLRLWVWWLVSLLGCMAAVSFWRCTTVAQWIRDWVVRAADSVRFGPAPASEEGAALGICTLLLPVAFLVATAGMPFANVDSTVLASHHLHDAGIRHFPILYPVFLRLAGNITYNLSQIFGDGGALRFSLDVPPEYGPGAQVFVLWVQHALMLGACATLATTLVRRRSRQIAVTLVLYANPVAWTFVHRVGTEALALPLVTYATAFGLRCIEGQQPWWRNLGLFLLMATLAILARYPAGIVAGLLPAAYGVMALSALVRGNSRVALMSARLCACGVVAAVAAFASASGVQRALLATMGIETHSVWGRAFVNRMQVARAEQNDPYRMLPGFTSSDELVAALGAVRERVDDDAAAAIGEISGARAGWVDAFRRVRHKLVTPRLDQSDGPRVWVETDKMLNHAAWAVIRYGGWIWWHDVALRVRQYLWPMRDFGKGRADEVANARRQGEGRAWQQWRGWVPGAADWQDMCYEWGLPMRNLAFVAAVGLVGILTFAGVERARCAFSWALIILGAGYAVVMSVLTVYLPRYQGIGDWLAILAGFVVLSGIELRVSERRAYRRGVVPAKKGGNWRFDSRAFCSARGDCDTKGERISVNWCAVMCGIAGAIATRSAEPAVRLMNGRLWHRGPDAEGYWQDENAVFGFRRLAVLDLREVASQPMVSPDGRYVLVFNGEIYNFRELRAVLRDGWTFRTKGDTEVLLAAFSAWGTRCLDKLNGMFAFAVWDRQERRLVLARDRLGEKPLFYFVAPGGGLLFASELPALMAHPAVPRTLSPKGVAQYLAFNYVLSSACIVEGVQKLGPGQYLVRDATGRISTRRYWNLAAAFREKREDTERELARDLLELVDDAVRMRLASDVPLGAFLSGGLDSSTVAASMCGVAGKEHTRTFTIGFRVREFDESAQARRVAGHLGTRHEERFLDRQSAGNLEQILSAAGEPFADTSMVPTWLLAGFAREQVTVALSGDGGDELFMGYPTYLADRAYGLLGRRLRSALGRLGRRLSHRMPVRYGKVGWDEKARRFFEGVALPWPHAHAAWRLVHLGGDGTALLTKRWREAVREMNVFEDFERLDAELEGCDLLDRASYIDIKTWLCDDILVKLDRATMAHSLEARVPLLDHRIVEFAARLPARMKLRGWRGKHLLRVSQRERLPPHVLRVRKQGFNAPVSRWLHEGMRENLERAVEHASEVFDRDRVWSLYKEHCERKANHELALFGVMSFGAWAKAADGLR